MTIAADRFAVAVRGQAHKRGLIPRLPTPKHLLNDIDAWLRREYPDEILDAALDATTIHVLLHPAAPPLRLTVDVVGAVNADAETTGVGPGYQRFIGRALDRMGAQLGIDWADRASNIAFADRPAVERAYLAWLGPSLVRAREAVRGGGRGIHLGMPAGTIVTCADALATVLGPRDEAWLEAAIADPRTAIGITPWWSDATDGAYLRSRALTRMWLDVRWRRPAVPGEAARIDEIHGLLSRAYQDEPELSYPWIEWAELIAYRGVEDGMARQVLGHAAQAGSNASGAARIGYRRSPVTIEHAGWKLTIPGDFAERRTADEWWGGGPGRSITLVATATGTGTSAMSAHQFLAQVASDLGPDALHHEVGDIRGRARLTTDTGSGVEIGVLEGFAAVAGSGAAIRIEFDDGEDYAWALEMWRSLRPG